MKEFGKWEQNIKEPFLTQMKKHVGRFEGWRAALKWVLTQKIQSTEEVLIDENAINKELSTNQTDNSTD